MQEFRRLQPGTILDRETVRTLNAMQEALEGLLSPRGGGELNATTRPGGLLLLPPDAPPALTWVTVTAPGVTSQRYESWSEVADDGAGGWTTPDDGATGSPTLPAFLPPDWPLPVPGIGQVVPAFPTAGGEAVVILPPPGAGPGGTLAVQGSTGTPAYAGVGTLVADQGNGLLTLSQPSAGAAMLTVNPGPAGSDAGLALAAHSFTRPVLPPPEDEANALIRGRVFNHQIPLPDPDAGPSTRGYVSLGLQVLGSGPKIVQGSLQVGGTTLQPTPGPSSTYLVVGTSTAPGDIAVGEVLFSPNAAGAYCSLTYDYTPTIKIITTAIPGPDQGGNVAFGYRLEGANKRFVLMVNGSGGSFSILNTSNGAYVDVGGMAVGGVVSGGNPGSLLGVDAGGNLGNVGVDDSGLILSGLVFAP